MPRIAVWCEAPGDFETITDLAERVLREEGPAWIRDHLERDRWASLRAWVGSGRAAFFDAKKIDQERRTRNILPQHNSFRGEDSDDGDPYGLLAYTAYVVTLHDADLSNSDIDGILFVWDMDNKGKGRRDGPTKARDRLPLPMIVGCPDLEREAWVLAGFEPKNAKEQKAHAKEQKALKFDPVRKAHQLRDMTDHGERSPKRVLKALTGNKKEREASCWMDTPLATLRKNGEESGLRAYVDELREHLLPLFSQK